MLMNAGMRIPSMVVIKASVAIQMIAPNMFCLLMFPTFRSCLNLSAAISEHKPCQPEPLFLRDHRPRKRFEQGNLPQNRGKNSPIQKFTSGQ